MMLLFAIATLTAMPAGGSTKTKAPDYVAVLVAKSFLRALAERDTAQAAALCNDAVNFDGHRVLGQDNVNKRIAGLVQRFPDGYRFRTVVFMTYREAVRRFGPPPKRLAPDRLKQSVVAFGRLPHKGLVIFVKKIKGRWRVVALSD